MEDIYSAQLPPDQTEELEAMFEKCGFEDAEWVDIPAWLVFTVTVPSANGGLLANQKQAVGWDADFFLRRIQWINLSAATPQVWIQITLPNGRYLQGGNAGGAFESAANAGVLTPGPLGTVKPEVRCPAGTEFTIDLLNVTGLWP
jgi:hypothetical protein